MNSPASGWEMDSDYADYATRGGAGHYLTSKSSGSAVSNPDNGRLPVGLIDFERCPLKDANDCGAGSWMVRSDGYKWWLVCGEWECPFRNRKRSDDD